MLEDQPQEPSAGDGSVCGLFCLAVLVTKGDLAVLAGDDILLLEHAFVEIAAKIEQRFLARADGGDVHDPGFGVAHGQFKSCLADSFEHFGSKDLGQGFVVEQIAGLVLAFCFFAALGTPPLFLSINGRGGHHQMHMRVVVEAA